MQRLTRYQMYRSHLSFHDCGLRYRSRKATANRRLVRDRLVLGVGHIFQSTIPTSRPVFLSPQRSIQHMVSQRPADTPSISYFALNRLCTSISFITEWNSHATTRKGLRVTNPAGAQRPAYFLQVPYRWAIPLTTMSGVLHWLLSQSFLRIDLRDAQGNLKPNASKSAVWVLKSQPAGFRHRFYRHAGCDFLLADETVYVEDAVGGNIAV
ncbi:uncharacterized protein BDZ99DRAFT_39707 [Mytilinidion resinicola]|uniref:Uncharacterized protein n=1 Tax=Mytilinidion resinicola TaxID=574789 RepID=A0A6A6YJP3_9PEZI|nr:uncharacterized protein BDZ99DRAFT_39707 [Mytilinidion resinicola]KAF2808778.1 hypothetical protein BDZ99DRAFT_39707 [Mytilinidion resinicola]